MGSRTIQVSLTETIRAGGARALWRGLLGLSAIACALALLLAGGVALADPLRQGLAAGLVAEKISYQGRLTDSHGNPLDGSYNLAFQLWDDAAAGSQVGSTITKSGVGVADGLFTVDLEVPQGAFNGQALWLRAQVNGQWLSPRQELLPAPYALSLRPGARTVGSLGAQSVLHVANDSPTDGSVGVFGGATARGGEVYGVYGETSSSSGRGVRGSATSSSGLTYGVFGNSASTSGRGVYGQAGASSGETYGVRGEAASTSGRGVAGQVTAATGETIGVRGESASTSGRGVAGLVTAASGDTFGVRGESASTSGRGVAGVATATTGATYGVYGRSESSSGRGVYGTANATSGTTYGVYGSSDATTGRGVYGVAGASSGDAIGVKGQSDSPGGYGGYFLNSAAGGAGLFARGESNADADIVLGGTSDSNDDGRIYSDPRYAGSDILLMSNDEVQVLLDQDNNEAGNFALLNGADSEVFSVDESGNVEYSGALIGAFPRPAYDSGFQSIDANTDKTFTHNLGGDVSDYVVDTTCYEAADQTLHQYGVGGYEHYVGGGGPDFWMIYGYYWHDLTTQIIKVKRYMSDEWCNYVRVRIWVAK